MSWAWRESEMAEFRGLMAEVKDYEFNLQSNL
jgi:hypothetical protein